MMFRASDRWSAAPIGQSWRRNWNRIIPFFDFPPEIRKVIYTIHAIELVRYSLRRLTKHRGAFPNDETAVTLFYLALRNISKNWTVPIRDWKAVLTRFTIHFEGASASAVTKILFTQKSAHARIQPFVFSTRRVPKQFVQTEGLDVCRIVQDAVPCA